MKVNKEELLTSIFRSAGLNDLEIQVAVLRSLKPPEIIEVRGLGLWLDIDRVIRVVGEIAS